MNKRASTRRRSVRKPCAAFLTLVIAVALRLPVVLGRTVTRFAISMFIPRRCWLALGIYQALFVIGRLCLTCSVGKPRSQSHALSTVLLHNRRRICESKLKLG